MSNADLVPDLPEREGYRPAHAAHLLSIGRSKIYDLIRQGLIRSIKIGACTIIPRTEIDRLLSGGSTYPASHETANPRA